MESVVQGSGPELGKRRYRYSHTALPCQRLDQTQLSAPSSPRSSVSTKSTVAHLLVRRHLQLVSREARASFGVFGHLGSPSIVSIGSPQPVSANSMRKNRLLFIRQNMTCESIGNNVSVARTAALLAWLESLHWQECWGKRTIRDASSYGRSSHP